jgi:hypothetical protein
MAGTPEHGNETPGSTKDVQFPYYLNDYWFLRDCEHPPPFEPILHFSFQFLVRALIN